MEIPAMISLAKDIITILAIIFGGIASLFIFFQLAPLVELRIDWRWTDELKKHLIVTYQITNRSRVRIFKTEARVQFLRHNPKKTHELSAWVPFEKDKIKTSEMPLEWQEPEKIVTSKTSLYPSETIKVERMYYVPEKNVLIHIGFQINARLGFWGRLATRKGSHWSQTTTSIISK